MFRNEGNKKTLEFILAIQSGQTTITMPNGFPVNEVDFVKIGIEEADRYWKLLMHQI